MGKDGLSGHRVQESPAARQPTAGVEGVELEGDDVPFMPDLNHFYFKSSKGELRCVSNKAVDVSTLTPTLIQAGQHCLRYVLLFCGLSLALTCFQS